MEATNRNDLEQIKTMLKSHACAICGAGLTIERNRQGSGYVLGCSVNKNHEGYKNLYHQGKSLDIAGAEREFNQRRTGVTNALATSEQLSKLTKQQMLARLETAIANSPKSDGKAKFSQDLTLAEKTLLADVARAYGLDFLLGEVIIYQGRPFVTIDARYRKAQETGLLDGVDGRMLTAQEKEAMGYLKDDMVWCSQVWKKGCSHAFTGYGVVHAKERTRSDFLPVVNNPQRMAEKRGDNQALKKAFSLPLPPTYGEAPEVIEDEIAEAERRNAIPVPLEDYQVKNDAPESVQTPSEKQAPIPSQTKRPDKSTAGTYPQAPANPDSVTEQDITTIYQLQKLCNRFWGMQPAEVLAELGVKSASDLAEKPWDCWMKIKSVKAPQS